jgi:hypothetical protein
MFLFLNYGQNRIIKSTPAAPDWPEDAISVSGHPEIRPAHFLRAPPEERPAPSGHDLDRRARGRERHFVEKPKVSKKAQY